MTLGTSRTAELMVEQRAAGALATNRDNRHSLSVPDQNTFTLDDLGVTPKRRRLGQSGHQTPQDAPPLAGNGPRARRASRFASPSDPDRA